MLQLCDLQVTINKNTAMQRNVLQGLSLNVAANEFITIIGNNGCGKSTLFNAIAGFITPDYGQIIIDKQDVISLNHRQRTQLTTIVMQDPRVGTMENMSIEENLSFAYLRGKSRNLQFHNTASRRQFFKTKLAILHMNLENRLDENVGNLSGGQRQALSLIMAIISDYKVLLLDEITAALDPKSAQSVVEIANRLVKASNKSAIMITHNMQHAIEYGNRTLLMSNGQFVKEYASLARLALSPVDLITDLELYA
jgi:putative ABC transport system ATP-binding protein